MWYQIVILAILSLSANAAIFQQPINRIVGGTPVKIEDFPHQVSIGRFNMYHICGGSILSEKFILSAGHCVVDYNPGYYHIRIGSSLSNDGGVVHAVKQIYPHESFNETTLDYDYSIFELDDPIQINNLTAKPVRLPEGDENIPTGANLTVTGWGDTRDSSLNEYQLRGVSLPKIDQIECTAAYLFGAPITDRMFCAGYRNGGMDSCQGDSGGPILNADKVQVGVVSWGFDCAKARYPGVYARVSRVRDWIRKIANV